MHCLAMDIRISQEKSAVRPGFTMKPGLDGVGHSDQPLRYSRLADLLTSGTSGDCSFSVPLDVLPTRRATLPSKTGSAESPA